MSATSLEALYDLEAKLEANLNRVEQQIAKYELSYFQETSTTGCGDIVRSFEPLEQAFVRNATRVKGLDFPVPFFRALPRARDNERLVSHSSVTGPAAAAQAVAAGLPPPAVRALQSYILVPLSDEMCADVAAQMAGGAPPPPDTSRARKRPRNSG